MLTFGLAIPTECVDNPNMPDGVKGNYTGAHCPPDKRQAIKEAILRSEPIQAIAERVGVCNDTVMAVRDREIPDWRKAVTQSLKETTTSLAAHFRDTPPEDIPWAVKPVMFGILMDKIALLEGEPTQIVEHRHTVDLGSLGLSMPQEILVSDLNADTTHTVEPSTGPESPHLLSNPETGQQKG